MAGHSVRLRRELASPVASALAACVLLIAADALAAAPPPKSITVVTDINYPPYFFQDEDGRPQGILIDKWNLWSRKTGVPVQVTGREWVAAQESLQSGVYDVIDPISHTARRAGLYEFSAPYAPVEARVYFHRTVSGISNAVATMRGFEIGAKAGSACAGWLADAGIPADSFRWYPTAEALAKAAGVGDVRLFCMDVPTAHYYLFKLRLAGDFRASPPLYTSQFHWAVMKGRTELRDFVQDGYARISAGELQAIEERWVGSPLLSPVARRYWYYLALVLAGILASAILLAFLNRSLRLRVAAKTAELSAALASLQGNAEALRESDTRLKLLVQASNIGLWDWTLADNRSYYSPEYHRQLGYLPGELTGRYEEWESLLHPDDKPRVLARLRECLASPELDYENDFRLLHRDGSYRWFYARGEILRDADGKPFRVVGCHIDVSDRKRAEETLAAERNLLRSLIDHAPVEIYLKDRDLRYLLMNNEALRLIGVAGVEEVVGKTARDFFSAEAARRIEDEDREVIRSGQPVLGVQRKRARDRLRWHSLSKVPLKDPEGNVTGLLTLNRDITELRTAIEQVRTLNVELEQRVQERTVELEDAVKELNAFSYSVSHDLRAPLRRVSGFLQMLRKSALERLTETERGMVQRIAASAQRMDQLIEDMLRLSRVAGQEIHLAEVDLSGLASEVTAELRGADPGRQVEIRIPAGMQARADPQLVRIVLDNLLGNSWKFTGKSAAPRIELGSTDNGGGPAFFVRDNGAGFDMQYADRLFSAFQRLHHQDEFPGTGVGLATVARIVRRHGGRIWAESRPDAGATFYFTLEPGGGTGAPPAAGG